ncbi:MAG: hypothetical protein SV775_00025 [Thermodesulfobacteriota bacterium]|nr:hypothetical protein [Thermodesulfobacteriota bacterium]
MAFNSFRNHDLVIVSDALDIAEDATANFYKFSLGQWNRHRYDVRTLSSLQDNEIRQHTFALLSKASKEVVGFESDSRDRDFYLICLQDHHILEALKRDKELGLLALLVYVLTHELVHIVRFCNFFKRFDVSGKEKEEEEKVVHATTFEILKGFSLPALDYVLGAYRDHRFCGMATV